MTRGERLSRERGDDMRLSAKTIIGALAVGAFVVSSAGLGYAGGGGAGGPGGEIFFSCYDVQKGPNPPHELEVDDQFINPTVEKVGKLKMICSFNPSVSVVGPGNPPPGLNAILDFDHITCYESPGAKTKAVVSYTDTFFGEPQTVKVDSPSKLICTTAVKTCLSGCPGITP
jgi:hypothetical protein